MSESPEERAMATVRKAEQMIADVKRKLEEGEEYLRQLGVDPEKVREFARKSVSAEDQRKAEEQVRKDLEEIDQEVREARLNQGGQDAPKAKRPRTVV